MDVTQSNYLGLILRKKGSTEAETRETEESGWIPKAHDEEEDG